MSTAASVYNLKTKTYFYLDSAYWLGAPFETLLTSQKLRHFAFDSSRHTDERGRAWLESLMKWIRDDGVFVVITDIAWHYPFFDDFVQEDVEKVTPAT